MSANNTTPNTDLPTAWALDDFGIPIAVEVEPSPQDIPYAIIIEPMAMPIAIPIEPPIAMPIAIPVEPNAQINAQINELERTNNILMAERSQAQERAQKEEKIKQQKQQQELEKAQQKLEEAREKQQKELEKGQQKLKEAQQKLKEAQRNQDIESQFNLTQTRLFAEYHSRISLAAECQRLGLFDKAIQQYNLSIDSMEKLCTAYNNKEYDKGRFWFTVPETYHDSILQSRLAIVNCLMDSGELELAYDSIASLPRTGNTSRAIEMQQTKCRDDIYKKAQKLIYEVSTMSTRNNPQQMAAAKKLLQNAEKLLIKISQGKDSNLVTQLARIEWDAIRDQVNQQCRHLLKTNVELNSSSYSNVVNTAREIIIKYSSNAKLLDYYELDCQTNILNMLPSLEQVAAQLKINDLTPTLGKCLSTGDIPNAYLVMHEIYNLAIQIKNPHYIEQKGLIYHDPQNYYLRLQNLESELQQFKLRAKQQHSTIVDQIIAVTLKKLGEKTKDASLLEKDLKDLRNTLDSIVQEKWHKFDRRSVPLDLVNTIAEKIVSDCDDIGIFKKWYHWSYATSCLKDTNKTLATIKLQVCEYVPTTNPDFVVNMNDTIRLKP